MKDKLKVYLGDDLLLDITKLTLVGCKKTLDIYVKVEIDNSYEIKGKLRSVSDCVMRLVPPSNGGELSG